MTTSIIIMAAGKAERCDIQMPKQLLTIPENETILGRLVRQVRRYRVEPIVIVRDHQLVGYCTWNHIPFRTASGQPHSLCHDILGTSDLWLDRTIVLLGDVIFTADGIEQCMTNTSQVGLIGNTAEMYALCFDYHAKSDVLRCLELGRDSSDNSSVGKLRYFYEHFAGIKLYSGTFEIDILSWLWDATNDIDTMDEYVQTVRNWNKGYG